MNIIYLLIFLSIYWILVSFTKIPKSTTDVFDIYLGAPVEQRLLKFKVEHIPLKFTSAKGLKCLKCCRWLSDLVPEACTCYQGNLLQMLVNVSLTCFFTCPPGLRMPQAHPAEWSWHFAFCYIYKYTYKHNTKQNCLGENSPGFIFCEKATNGRSHWLETVSMTEKLWSESWRERSVNQAETQIQPL